MVKLPVGNDFSFLKAQNELHKLHVSGVIDSCDLWIQAMILRFEAFR